MNRATTEAQAGTGFELVRHARVASLNVGFQEYRHARTGARHVHLDAQDSNNTFTVAFATVPTDSTGVAHILEHTVLCGSRRFPVRDPFFMMLRRSLNTFMNAFTSSDATAYPFATQNRKDFDNLLQVYLDAAFFPRLDPLDFAQEGHRIEFEDPDDSRSALVYKGVVYNEMKGAMSAPVSQLWFGLAEHLFPSSTYHYNSGGDPREIPRLDYAELKAFHERHYHPSNAVFFTYGDFPVAEHQRRIDELVLQYFDDRREPLTITDERRLEAPLRVQKPYPVSAQEGTVARTHVVLGWLLGRSNDARAMMRARLLEAVLLQDSAAPLRRALETSELGKAPSELCGLDDSPREAVFVCGLEGSEVEHADAVEALVLDVLETVAREGIPAADVEAALYQMELAQREVSSRFPYGLQLTNRMLPAAIHGGDLLAELDIDPVLEELRAAIADPQFVPALVREWLLDNAHRVRLTLKPDLGLAAQEQAAERERLDAVAARLDEAGRARIIERARALLERQGQEDDPDLLPRVGLQDVPAEVRVPSADERALPLGRSAWYAAGTNGLVHEQLIVTLPRLDAAQIASLALFWNVITELGCGGRDYLAMQAHQSRTGRLSAYVSVRGAIDDSQRLRAYFVVAGEGLARNHGGLAELMRDTFTSVRFDETRRLRELVAQMRADAEAAVTSRGHTLAALAAARGMGPAARLFHAWNGLEGVQHLKRLDAALADDAAMRRFTETLRAIHGLLIDAPRQLLVVSEATYHQAIADALAEVWPAATASGGFEPFAVPFEFAPVAEGWSANTQVNFCARAYPAVAAEHPDAAVLCVLAHFLRDGFLHRVIREQGGAYGGGAGFDADSATFRFYSYRDPRLAETLADFDRALDWVQERHPGRRVEEAILGAIKDLDQPASPAGEAVRACFDALHGRTPDFRRRFRSRVLAVTLEDLQRVARERLVPARASTAVIGSEDALGATPELGLDVHVL